MQWIKPSWQSTTTKKSPKEYQNKNLNVEYYYDGNGDIKRRKIKNK